MATQHSKASMKMQREDLFLLLQDRFSAWELVDLLGISTEDICYAFEDQIYDNLEDLKEYLGLSDDNENEEDYTDE